MEGTSAACQVSVILYLLIRAQFCFRESDLKSFELQNYFVKPEHLGLWEKIQTIQVIR
jgi:hypothetical protein